MKQQTSNNQNNCSKKKHDIFEDPFSFKGRISRTEIWFSWLLVVLINNFLKLFFGPLISEVGGIIFSTGIQIVLLWFIIAQNTKRCHDLGHNGWWQLIPFYSFWMGFAKGQDKDNEYGEPIV